MSVLDDSPVFPILLSLDLDATRAFYHGRPGSRDPPRGSWRPHRLPVRRRDAARSSREHVGTSDTQTQVAWRVPDIHAAVAELRAMGCGSRSTRRQTR